LQYLTTRHYKSIFSDEPNYLILALALPPVSFRSSHLYRLTTEIIADLPTVYEMPREAVQWCQDMIDYTVAGGKMNRGLAVVAVQQTFAKSKGRTLTNKVRTALSLPTIVLSEC
jgi:Polyprenyl synthetase